MADGDTFVFDHRGGGGGLWEEPGPARSRSPRGARCIGRSDSQSGNLCYFDGRRAAAALQPRAREEVDAGHVTSVRVDGGPRLHSHLSTPAQNCALTADGGGKIVLSSRRRAAEAPLARETWSFPITEAMSDPQLAPIFSGVELPMPIVADVVL